MVLNLNQKWADRASALPFSKDAIKGRLNSDWKKNVYAEIVEPFEVATYDDLVRAFLKTGDAIRVSTRKFSNGSPEGPWQDAKKEDFYSPEGKLEENLIDAMARSARENGFMYVHFPLHEMGNTNPTQRKLASNEIGFMQIGGGVYSTNASVPVLSLQKFGVVNRDFPIAPNQYMAYALFEPSDVLI